jgi:hypothetical protein
MKSIFDAVVRDEVSSRINALTATTQSKWGKMNVAQMVRHCSICEEYYFGNIEVERSFLGRIIGKWAMNSTLKDERSTLQRNAHTSPSFKVVEEVPDFDGEKQKWKSLVARYAEYTNTEFTHWFFGKMTKDQLGQFIYKHCDHHLRQFGV